MKTIKLKKIANVITGFPFKGNQYSNVGIRTVRGENVTEGKLRWDAVKCWNQKFDNQQEYLLKVDDVVIGMDGSKVGKNKAQIKERDLPLLLAQRVACVRALNENNQVFLYYLINNPKFEKYVFRTQTGSSVPHISKTQIEEFEVPQIDILTQKNIAKVLSDLDAKIEINNRINTELEAMAKTLYDFWFLQFDFPYVTSSGVEKPYKSSGGKMVWNEALKRDIPRGWEVQPLNKVIETILDHRGKTPKKLGGDWTDDENGIIALSAKIVKGGKLNNLRQANKVSKELYEKWMPIKLIDGDILMTSEAPAGEFYFIQGKTDYCMSQRLFGIRANQLKMVPSYLYYELSKGNGYSQIMGSLSGSTVFGIRQDVLRKILVVVPNLEIQKEFNKIVLPQLKQIKQLYEQNQELASLRDWLLPMLMNGQVSVGDVEALRQAQADMLGMVAEPTEIYKN